MDGHIPGCGSRSPGMALEGHSSLVDTQDRGKGERTVRAPSVTAVVVPARNEERRLPAALAALAAARSYPEDVPGGSTAPLVRVAEVLDRCTTAPSRSPRP